jgi:uncharacterized membrane protein
MSITTEQVQILVTAIDNASKTFQNVADQMEKVSQKTSQATTQMQRLQSAQKTAVQSAKDLTYASVALASAGLGLFNVWDNYIDSQMRVDRANIRVQRSIEAVEKAQKAYDAAIKSTTVDSDKLMEATLKRDRAQSDIRKSGEKLLDAQRELNIAIREEGTNSIRATEAREALTAAQEEVGFAQTEATLAENERNKVIAGTDNAEVVQQLKDNLSIAQQTLDYNKEMLDEMKEQQSGALASALIQTPIHLLTIIGSLGTIIGILGAKSVAGGVGAAAGASGLLGSAATGTAAGVAGAGLSGMGAAFTGGAASTTVGGVAVGAGAIGAGLAVGVPALAMVAGLSGVQREQMRKSAEAAQEAIKNQQSTAIYKTISTPIGNVQVDLQSDASLQTSLRGLYNTLTAQHVVNGQITPKIMSNYDAGDWVAKQYLSLKNQIPALAEGGLVTKPTLALIGERGPEMVVPINSNSMGDTRQNITVYTTVSIANVSSSMDLKTIVDKVSEGISSALKRRR